MREFQPNSYGDQISGVYDDLYPTADPDCISLLASLAGGGPVLELGIGTGRVALPLRAAGIEVHGIDASESMLDLLRVKSEPDPIRVTTGDFKDFNLEIRYPLIYVVFNTLFALTAQEDQIRCFSSVARHLVPGGRFLVEAFVPDLSRFTGNQSLRAVEIGESKVQVDASLHDPATQTIISQHILIDRAGTRLYPVKLRYIWPSEMDLMARIAGLDLVQRWGSWQKIPFGSTSPKHISIYRLQDG